MAYHSALITGAGRGIGAAIAKALAERGMNLALCARSAEPLEITASYCRGSGVRCTTICADIGRIEELDRVVEFAKSEMGVIDVLINCAGICPTDGVDNVDEALWDSVMDINAKGLFFLSQKVLRHMKERRCGYIVNISSTVALGAKPGVTVYSASKFAVSGITQALYEEAKAFEVKVSAIYPGVTDTPMLREQEMPCTPDQWMLPEDIAACVLFLLDCSPRMIVRDIVPWSVRYDQI